jgi:hypothetical protein
VQCLESQAVGSALGWVLLLLLPSYAVLRDLLYHCLSYFLYHEKGIVTISSPQGFTYFDLSYV